MVDDRHKSDRACSALDDVELSHYWATVRDEIAN